MVQNWKDVLARFMKRDREIREEQFRQRVDGLCHGFLRDMHGLGRLKIYDGPSPEHVEEMRRIFKNWRKP